MFNRQYEIRADEAPTKRLCLTSVVGNINTPPETTPKDQEFCSSFDINVLNFTRPQVNSSSRPIKTSVNVKVEWPNKTLEKKQAESRFGIAG